jgi:hypothetical protein
MRLTSDYQYVLANIDNNLSCNVFVVQNWELKLMHKASETRKGIITPQPVKTCN